MTTVYNNLKIELSFPETWKRLNENDYSEYGIVKSNEINILDAFIIDNEAEQNMVTFQLYGNEANFIEAIYKELSGISKKINKLEDKTPWQEQFAIKPLVSEMVPVSDKKVYVTILEIKETKSINVLQIYFMFNRVNYCFNTNIKPNFKDFKDAISKNPIIEEVLEIIKGVKNVK